MAQFQQYFPLQFYCVSSIIKRKEKETKKLIKMTLEAIILMIYGYYKTIKMRDNSKTKHVE